MSENIKQVLVVEDDPAALRLVSHHLLAGGYEVLSATTGQNALQILRDQAPSLVLTDWELPGISGVELCQAIRAHEEIGFVYLIVLTAHAETERLVQAFDAGVDDYLVKPWKEQELLARLRAGERVVALERDLARRTREIAKCGAEMELAYRKLAVANERLERVATTDELTGLTNRRAAIARMDEAWAMAIRHDEPLACMLIDIDFFKSINDTFGHVTGDVVLRSAAETLQRHVRRDEMVCRIGGEEFLVVCPKSTADEAAVGAERQRRTLESTTLSAYGQKIKLTISVGVAERTRHMTAPEELLKSADEALYAAKRSGRNRVCIAGKVHRVESDSVTPVESPSPWPHDDEPNMVLLVDPDIAPRAQRRAQLEQHSITVAEADDGRGALAVAKRRRPQAIIITGRRHRNDLDCLEELRNDCVVREIPLLLISAKGQSVIDGLEAGADDAIAADPDPRELALRVRALARVYRGRLELNHAIDARGEQARMLMLLSELTRALASMDDLNEMLDYILRLTAELASSRRVVIMLPGDDSPDLRIRRSIGLDPAQMLNVSVAVGAGVAGRVFLTRETLVIDDGGIAGVTLSAGEEAIFGGGPMMCAALSNSEHVVGVLAITDRHPGKPAFDPRETECIELIANIAASSIHDLLARRSRDEARDSIVFALAQLAEQRDDDTGKHLYRVTQFALMLAAELRTSEPYAGMIDEAFLHDLERAVPLHDIGKVAIPDSILLKPGKLTPDEGTIMRTHAEIGAQTITSVMARAPGMRFLDMAKDIALGHHEWFDGSGYPRQTAGLKIPLCARLVAVADVYDAVTSNRTYRKAMPHQEAVRLILEHSGTQFDPHLVEVFLKCERRFEEVAARFADSAARQSGKPLMRLGAVALASVR